MVFAYRDIFVKLIIEEKSMNEKQSLELPLG